MFHNDTHLHCCWTDALAFVTFKAKTDRMLKKIRYNEKNVIITIQAKGWMDQMLMQKWIRTVLLKHTKGRHALLVFDTFKGHLQEEVLSKLTQSNITYVTIPGGCTSKVQPLDVCLNKPFKAHICGAWEEYTADMASSIHTASKSDVEWIADANKCLHSQTDMVKKSFLVCGIANNLNGSESGIVRVAAEIPSFEIPLVPAALATRQSLIHFRPQMTAIKKTLPVKSPISHKLMNRHFVL